MAEYAGAEAFIEILNTYGLEYIFYNPGYDIVPILQAVANYRIAGKRAPRAILCLDESVAMAAAHGNFMISGQPQVVLVHSELGTQQVGGALHQAQWGRVPVVLCAGLSGPAYRATWKQEPYDQGSIVRNCVKWEHQLGDDENLGEVLQQALQTASTGASGPVYLCFPRDALFKKIDIVLRGPENKDSTSIAPDTETLDKVAEMLLKSENPLILTGYSGRHHQSVASLVELAETLGARVVAAPIRMNFPANHHLCAGVEPNDGGRNVNPYLSLADVLLVIDYDLPYVPPRVAPSPDARIIHIDIDHLKRGQPLWGRKADVRVEADSRIIIPALNELIHQKITPERHARINDRSERLKSEHQCLRDEWHAIAMNSADKSPISPDWFCHCLNEAIDEDTIIINQTITSSVSVARQVHRHKPGTLLACSGGSIGWALPAALGAKLAAPDRTVVSLMGDGAFVYGCPTATLWPATYQNAPFLSVIFNNQAYGALKGHFRVPSDEDRTDVDIAPPPDYTLIAQACGAYGRAIEKPADVLPVLKEALAQVGQGRPAVIDFKMKPA